MGPSGDRRRCLAEAAGWPRRGDSWPGSESFGVPPALLPEALRDSDERLGSVDRSGGLTDSDRGAAPTAAPPPLRLLACPAPARRAGPAHLPPFCRPEARGQGMGSRPISDSDIRLGYPATRISSVGGKSRVSGLLRAFRSRPQRASALITHQAGCWQQASALIKAPRPRRGCPDPFPSRGRSQVAHGGAIFRVGAACRNRATVGLFPVGRRDPTHPMPVPRPPRAAFRGAWPQLGHGWSRP